jgi:hypothetical protein
MPSPTTPAPMMATVFGLADWGLTMGEKLAVNRRLPSVE